MRVKEAIILAGGMGTRLQSKVPDIPKPMALIGNVPFLEFLFNYLKAYQIEHVILSVGYKWEIIRDHFGDRFKNIRISYAVEVEPLGTGGGIKLALGKAVGEDVYILNGDTFFDVNLDELAEFYYTHQSDIAITVKRKNNFDRYGTVKTDTCRVVAFAEKQAVKSGLINGGVYLMKKNLFDIMNMPDKFSLEIDFLEKFLEDLKICAMKSKGYFIDIGIPSDYVKASRELPAKMFP